MNATTTISKISRVDKSEAIDVEIGKKVRQLRSALGVTQKVLAARIGVSYQQMQKYETGQNRMSAGRLSQISEVLEVPVEFFYRSDYEDGMPKSTSERWQLELSKNFSDIESEEVRSALITLVKAIAKPSRK